MYKYRNNRNIRSRKNFRIQQREKFISLLLSNGAQYQVTTVKKELPCLSMEDYIFSPLEVRKRKEEISENLKEANYLIQKELKISQKT